MDKRSLKLISAAALDLPEAPTSVLSGALLTARFCCDALERSSELEPIRGKEIAALVHEWRGQPIDPSNVSQIIGALRDGGLQIKSATSKGYWVEG